MYVVTYFVRNFSSIYIKLSNVPGRLRNKTKSSVITKCTNKLHIFFSRISFLIRYDILFDTANYIFYTFH